MAIHGKLMEAQTLMLLKDGSGDGGLQSYPVPGSEAGYACAGRMKFAWGFMEVHRADSARTYIYNVEITCFKNKSIAAFNR